MNIYLNLFLTFAKIGLFSFGGGYAMIPVIRDEVLSNAWLTELEYSNIVTVSQMTPGPLAVNAATYVGYSVGGVGGSALATLGVALPSFIIVVIMGMFMRRFRDSTAMNGILTGIRPVTIALLVDAVIFFALGSFVFVAPSFGVHWGMLAVFLIAAYLIKVMKMNAIWVIIISAGLGLFLA